MNEKALSVQSMDTTEKQALMESLAARYNLLGLHTFDHWGQSCHRHLQKDGRGVRLCPRRYRHLGWEQFAED